jgi:hypothetical protein
MGKLDQYPVEIAFSLLGEKLEGSTLVPAVQNIYLGLWMSYRILTTCFFSEK